MVFEAGRLLAFLPGHLFSYPDSQSRTRAVILLPGHFTSHLRLRLRQISGEIHAL